MGRQAVLTFVKKILILFTLFASSSGRIELIADTSQEAALLFTRLGGLGLLVFTQTNGVLD